VKTLTVRWAHPHRNSCGLFRGIGGLPQVGPITPDLRGLWLTRRRAFIVAVMTV